MESTEIKALFEEMDKSTKEAAALFAKNKPLLGANAFYRSQRLHAKINFEMSKMDKQKHIELAEVLIAAGVIDPKVKDILITFNGRINNISQKPLENSVATH